jgi:hypothetical protein
MVVDSSLRDLVGHEEYAAGEAQKAEKSGALPAPTRPVVPLTVIVYVPPILAGPAGKITSSILLAFALMVSVTRWNVNEQVKTGVGSTEGLLA